MFSTLFPDLVLLPEPSDGEKHKIEGGYVATCALSSPAANALPFQSQEKCDCSERDLVRQAQNGDHDAFGILYERHQKRILSLCLLMTKDAAEAEDLTQEAFLQVFRTIKTFRGDAAFSTWLYRIAVNTVLMDWRRRKSKAALSLSEPILPDSPSPARDIGMCDSRLSGAVDRIALLRAYAALPDGCRTIFALHEIQGYQHPEIAYMLHCSIGNSKSQLHKAKLKMRGLLFPKRKVLGQKHSPPITSADCSVRDE